MLKVLFGSPTGILAMITVAGSLAVIIGWAVYWVVKINKERK